MDSAGKQAKEYWTLQEIAQRWNCSHSTVLTHCQTGELRAIDISTNRRKRAHYLVPDESLRSFEESRSTPQPEKPVARRKRVKLRPSEVIEFFA